MTERTENMTDRQPQAENSGEGVEILDLLEQSMVFAGLATFARAPQSRDLEGADLVVMGVPFDSGTLNRSGTRLGPRAIREQSVYANAFKPVYPWDYDLTERFGLVDFGDVVPIPGTGAVEFMLELTEAVADEVFAAGASLLTIGGDHTIPYGPVRAAAKRYGKLSLIHLDSHQDSADSKELGGEYEIINHGTFATGLANEGHVNPSKSVQAYIRTRMYDPVGYEIVYAEEALRMGPESLAEKVKDIVGEGPAYLTLDIDSLDPAYAPGNGSPVPGGPSTGELRRFLKALDGVNVVGADLVEVNPHYDPTQATAIAASFLALDLLHIMGNAREGRQAAREGV